MNPHILAALSLMMALCLSCASDSEGSSAGPSGRDGSGDPPTTERQLKPGHPCQPESPCDAGTECTDIGYGSVCAPPCPVPGACVHGSACEADDDCHPGLICDRSSGSPSGTCSRTCRPDRAWGWHMCDGGECLPLDDASRGLGGVCGQPLQVGGPCAWDRPCPAGSVCQQGDGASAGLCRPRIGDGFGYCDGERGSGVRCTANAPCAEGECVAECPPGFVQLADGACFPKADCDPTQPADGCADGEHCRVAHGRVASGEVSSWAYCGDLGEAAVGEPCGEAACAAGAVCIGGVGREPTCHEVCPAPAGDWPGQCDSQENCANGRCCVDVSCGDSWAGQTSAGFIGYIVNIDTCSPLSQQGCDAGERCSLAGGSRGRLPTCAPIGTKAPGQVCEPGDCESGAVCAMDSAGRGQYRCREICDLQAPSESCVGKRGRVCAPLRDAGEMGVGVCEDACGRLGDSQDFLHCADDQYCGGGICIDLCDPTASSCGERNTCQLPGYPPGDGVCSEALEFGAQPCEGDGECPSGMCIQQDYGSPAGVCAKLACTPGAGGGCPPTASCIEIPDGRGFCGYVGPGLPPAGAMRVTDQECLCDGRRDFVCRPFESAASVDGTPDRGLCILACREGASGEEGTCMGRPDLCQPTPDRVLEPRCWHGPEAEPCDLLTGASCATKHACIPIMNALTSPGGAATSCSWDVGERRLGETCTFGSSAAATEHCDANLWCAPVREGDWPTGGAECVGFCDLTQADDCPRGSRCNDVSLAFFDRLGELGVCMRDDACHVGWQNCGEGQTCLPVTVGGLRNGVGFATRCVEATGEIPVGGSCQDTEQCGPEAVCMRDLGWFRDQDGSLISGCQRMCAPDDPSACSDGAAGSCVDLSSQIGAPDSTLGVCVAPTPG